MNKGALKKFATEARRELLERVELQARKIGITKDLIQTANVESSDAVFIDGVHLSHIERKQRNKLIARIDEIGFERVMDETAYTWFNRFVALRFMEVNQYLPTKVRILSSSNEESVEPDMMREALSLDLDMDKEHIYELKMNNDTDGLFKYLIKVHCNDLNRYMPFIFESVEDYKEILFPEGLLGSDALISRLINVELIPEEDWTNIEIIGWLYQYYIAEEKDRVFKAKAKYKAEEIPYATQLFTPDWIVQYMVQNSLGRYWTEAHPEHEDLINDWNFFIRHEENDFQEKIAPYVNKELNVEDIKCFDPAMGSGHILVYMFDVLYEIYTKCGYMEREIPRLIIENNLYGLDIDDRAHQLASFSVVMKALQYNRRFFRSIEREGLVLNLASVQETNGWTEELYAYLAGDEIGSNYDSVKLFIQQYRNGKTFGSLIRLSETNTLFFEKRLRELRENPVTNLFEEHQREQILELLPLLIHQTKIMRQQYDVVVMNPPYMGSRSMNKSLSDFLGENYKNSKSDLFAAFMEIDHYLKKYGLYAAINQHSWMFLSSFERLRKRILKEKFIDTMLHLGTRTFEDIGGEVVQSTTFVLRNMSLKNSEGIYLRLLTEKNTFMKKDSVRKYVNKENLSSSYFIDQKLFLNIPGNPIAYWSDYTALNHFEKIKLKDIATARAGMITGNNTIFTKAWYEVSFEDIGLGFISREEAKESRKKWFPYHKGGGFRRWYGNHEFVVDWEFDGYNLQNKRDENGKIPAHAFNFDHIFKEAITWSAVTTSKFSARNCEGGFLFDAGGSFARVNENRLYVLGLLNSKVAEYYLSLINPTLNFQKGNVENIPIIYNSFEEERINELVKNCITISKNDWDSFETSWEFITHPLLKSGIKEGTIKESCDRLKQYIESQQDSIKSLENEINYRFINAYGLMDQISAPEDSDISVRNVNIKRDMISLISYIVGCSLGRYSLDEKGLIYAGGMFNHSRYKIFPTDKDNILPILSGKYFEDDIVTKVIDFVRITFHKETLEENLNFIADALGRKANETSRETLRRYFLNDFYKDHVQTYKKRPIYWLFTSGKEKAFNCLIYMHRYDKTTLSRIRTDYLHEVQNRMDAEKKDLLAIIEGDSTTKEISSAKKTLKSLDKKIDELKAYDELLHHMADQQIEIDLDDGVKVNYEKFKGLVAKIN
ncbi:BREX-1 system adenine-specific DNA-methyltransferase PglX [Exiguobacterium sp. s55]|uniref:BREX-1 system adenine-specific DNA-methyltransferase PglX n=1 Tax=Exiguobacterium sp. s55 TaxID=2751245 RepID=UPI001BEB6A3E|nr:BREX-1 system adenine-specific DNA-methyltransferase PglX [Exiguobacterium sp. s55]